MVRSHPFDLFGLLCGIALAFMPSITGAQGEPRPFAWDLARGVLIDPTTYVPAVLSYESQRMDWKTSQVLFERGWMEANPGLTVSGRPNDVPLSNQAGGRLMRKETLSWFGQSLINNTAVGIFERVLVARNPKHRKLIHALSWAERISFASYTAYLASVEHFRQAGKNRQLARAYGYSQ